MAGEVELKICMCKESVQKVLDQLDAIKVKAEATLKAIRAVYDEERVNRITKLVIKEVEKRM